MSTICTDTCLVTCSSMTSCRKMDHTTIKRSFSSLKTVKVKVKAYPYLIPSVGPGADTGVQAVSPQVTVSHPPAGRLPLLSTRPAVTFPATEHHRDGRYQVTLLADRGT